MDLLDWARTLFALIATLALIVGAAYAARRLGMLQPGGPGIKRMRVSETLLIDTRRRMVIVRVDEREHVLLLGPAGDVVVSDMAAKDAPAGGDDDVSEARKKLLWETRWGKIALIFGASLAMSMMIGVGAAYAAATNPTLSVNLGTGDGLTSRVLQLAALITVLSLAPSIIIMTTSFVRIVVVLSLLRIAIGLQQAPPNVVIVSLSLFLTAFVMQPVWNEAYQAGIGPVMNEEMPLDEAFPRIVQPLKVFMVAQTRQDDLALFINMARLETPPANAEETPLRILAPAFMISELRRSFEIGFMLFVPFVIIDLVVASLLMAMGMMMMPPVTVSLPFKLIFFVLVDGWRLVAGSLIESFNAGAPPGG